MIQPTSHPTSRTTASLPAVLLAAFSFFWIQPPPAAADPEVLDDSTAVETWSLANGLQVVTRHVPRAQAIAIVTCYRNGYVADPEGREGLAWVLAEAGFRAAAGDVPERTRNELATLRPLGWNIKVTPYLTHFAEIASPAQFAGVLHQVAARARAATITDELLQQVLPTVREHLAENFAGSVELAVYHDVRAVAAGTTLRLPSYRSGKGLDGVTAKELQQHWNTRFVPANAVLSIAGNLSGFDLRRLIEREFGAIPSGTALPGLTAQRLQPGVQRLAVPKLPVAVGGVGVIAPAVTDTMHPSFTLHALLIGSFCKQRWGPGQPPLEGRFDYSVLDEPDLARVYPPILREADDSTPVVEEYHFVLADLPVTLERDAYKGALENVTWMIGGAMPAALVRRMRREPGALYTLASGGAARAQWGDAAFWAEYRRRFDQAAGRDMGHWRAYFGAVENVVQLKLVPEKGTAVR